MIADGYRARADAFEAKVAAVRADQVEVEVPADAPLQDRLLGYVGRDPVSKSV